MNRTLLAALAAIAAAAGAVFFLFESELGQAREAATAGSMLANTPAGLIEYAVKGEGIALLSIHGAGGGFDQGLANAAGLVGDGFQVIAPSRFGYLRTPVPQDESPAAQADVHAALLSSLHVAKAVVLGISAGTRSAVEFAIRHPDAVSALILIMPALYAPGNPVSIRENRGNKFAFWVVNHGGDFAWWAAEKIAPSMLIRFVGVQRSLVAAASQAEQERVMGIVKSIEPLSLRFPGINVDSTADLHELPLEGIKTPVMLISTRDDLFNTLPAAEYAAGKIPGAKLVVYETGGHLLVGRGQEARNVVRAFLVSASLMPPSQAAARE
jgi:2-hydroxy-6-oxonona-2,4-dienedioate hydrolase